MALLKELREAMMKLGVERITTNTSDAHDSEYIAECDNLVKFISGFTGSNGLLDVTQTEAALYTDGRYFIQAERELKGTGIEMRDMMEYENLPKPLSIQSSPLNDIVTTLWPDRPARPANPIWIFAPEYAGESSESKLNRLRQSMSQNGLSSIDINHLDDIAWLLNLRGSDIPNNPVFYAFLHVEMSSATVYIQTACADEGVRSYLSGLGIEMREYADYKTKEEYSSLAAELKSHKTDFEIDNIRNAVLRDSIYVTKFICWLKKNGSGLTEIEVSDKLERLRRTDDRFISLSFDTISAYGPNGAIVHYEADEKSNAVLEPHGLYLVDSGAQYLDGTTDVTRTVAMGPLTTEGKLHYTLVCMGMLRVMNAHFDELTDSAILDEIARRPLKEHGLDFNHGTGHGIGYVGCVHEGPAGIKRAVAKKPYSFSGGEIISDEPGVYIENEHGVRIENMLCYVERHFENLTWVPLEREAIDWSVMTEEDKKYFEDYQSMVIEKISPYLDNEERIWLNSQ